jgi:prevent-host-death family protein
MSQTISVTKARDNFPALVRQVAEQDEPVVVTSRNQPQVVLVRWKTYQAQQTLQSEAAAHRLHMLAQEMLTVATTLQEAYRPYSYDLAQGTQELQTMAREAWATCRLLDKPRRHLALTLSDALLNLGEAAVSLTQLEKLIQIIPLLSKNDVSLSEVAEADRTLHAVGLDAVPPIGDDLVALYEQEA